MKKLIVSSIALCAAIMSAPTWAAQAAGTSVTKKSNLLENIKLTYSALYHGPSIGDVGNEFLPDEKGDRNEDPGNLQYVEDTLSLGYKLSPEMTVSGNYNFLLWPIRPQPLSGEKGLVEFLDPTVKLTHNKLYDDGNGLNLSGGFRAYLPMSEGSKKKNLITQLRADFDLGWAMPNSRWTIGSEETVRYYMYSADKKTGSVRSFYIYLSPYAAYQIRQNVSFKFGFEKEMIKMNQLAMNTGNTANGYVSLNWDVAPKILLSPAITFYPTNLTMNASSFSLTFVAGIL